MILKEILKESWESKGKSVFFNSWEEADFKELENEFRAFFNGELLKKKRLGKIHENATKITPIDQNFDDNNFNFEKIACDEILFGFKHDPQTNLIMKVIFQDY